MMFEKITTIVRSGVRESVEHVIDANSLRIFEQEIYDCETSLAKSKLALTQVVAEKMNLQRQVDNANKLIQKREKQARELFEKGEEEIIEEIAQSIVEEEEVLSSLNNALDVLMRQEKQLITAIKLAAHKVKGYRRELSVAKAVKHRQAASSKLAQVNSQVTLASGNLEGSLKKIKEQQQRFDDQFEAAQEVDICLSENQIDTKLNVKEIEQKEKLRVVMDRVKGKPCER